MSRCCVLLVTMIGVSVAFSASDVEGGVRRRLRMQQPCLVSPIECVAPEPPLPPITTERQVATSVEVSEVIIGPDGKPRTVTKTMQQMRTETVVLTTANQQIRYLNEQLNKIQKEKVDLEKFKQLEEGKVDPLKVLVESIRSTFASDKK